MDKVELYRILDISEPDDFKYYENLAALIEEEKYIESNLIKDLFKDVDRELLLECMGNYFEELLKLVPDKENELYITIDQIKLVLTGLISDELSIEELDELTNEFYKFRKWFALDQLAIDLINKRESSIRDAIYDIAASKYIDQKCEYDFRLATNYDFEGYDIKLSDIVGSEEE